MNQNVKTMKDALASYHQKAKKADEAISKARSEYKPEVANERIDRIESELKQERAKTIDIIRRASEQGKAEIKKRYELNPADITDDAKLLQSGFPMNQADFDSMCRKYESNGTMCRILAEYAETRNKKVQALHPKEVFPEGYLHTMNLPNEKAMTDRYDRLVTSAEGIINNMEGHGWGKGVNDPFVVASVEGFGERE